MSQNVVKSKPAEIRVERAKNTSFEIKVQSSTVLKQGVRCLEKHVYTHAQFIQYNGYQ